MTDPWAIHVQSTMDAGWATCIDRESAIERSGRLLEGPGSRMALRCMAATVAHQAARCASEQPGTLPVLVQIRERGFGALAISRIAWRLFTDMALQMHSRAWRRSAPAAVARGLPALTRPTRPVRVQAAMPEAGLAPKEEPKEAEAFQVCCEWASDSCVAPFAIAWRLADALAAFCSESHWRSRRAARRH